MAYLKDKAAKTSLATGDKLAMIDHADSDKVKLVNVENARPFMQSRQPAPDPIVSDDIIDLTGVDGNTGTITGTTKINTILLEEGRTFEATFEDDLVIGHNASAVTLPGNLDLKVKAGDTLRFIGEAGDVVSVDTIKQADNRITDPEAVESTDVVHAHRITLETMTVAGAGTTEANGDYLKRGTNNGKSYYILEGQVNDPDTGIRWDGSQWKIPAVGVSSVAYVSSEDVATPDLVVTWTLGDGSNPVPTVTKTAASNELIPTTVSKLGAFADIVAVADDLTLTPDDTGKLFIQSSASKTFTLPPLADCVPGETRYFLLCTTGSYDLVADGSDKTYYTYIDSGTVTGTEASTISGIPAFGLIEVRAVTSDHWAIIGGPIK